MVLVNACWRTLTAFSQGELPCAKAGAASSSPAATVVNCRNAFLNRRALPQSGFILGISFVRFLQINPLGEFPPGLLSLGDLDAEGRSESLQCLVGAKAHLEH